MLPVNWFGLVFIVTAFVLFIVDIKAATHGGLTVAGVGSFIAGALILFNSPGTPDFQRVSLPLVILAIFAVGFGWLGIPEHFTGGAIPNWIHEFVGGTLLKEPEVLAFNIVPLLTSLVVALGGLALGWWVHPAWFLFTAFVGVNLLQSSFTGFCPLERILVHHEGLERAHQGLGVELSASAGRAQEGVALDALVGAQREQAQLALAAELSGVPAVGGGRDVFPREQREGDVGDLHETPSPPAGRAVGAAPSVHRFRRGDSARLRP